MSKQRFEFVVEGPPCTANNDNSKRKTQWKQDVGTAAYRQWVADGRFSTLLPINTVLEVYVTTYCRDILYDVDNVLKWTLDGLNANERPRNLNHSQRRIDATYKSLYGDDRLIHKLTSERIDLKSAVLEAPSAIINDAQTKFDEFLHIALFWEEGKD